MRERRQFPRITQPFDVRYRISGEFTAAWCAATLVNLSAGGMRIRSADPIPPDAVLDLEFQLPSTHAPFVLRGRVLWDQIQAAGVIEYGIAFLEPDAVQQIQIDEVVRFFGKSGPAA